MNHTAFRLPLNAVSVLGAAGAPSARRGIRCPGPAATHAGERRPLLQGLRKAIPLNPHGGPGRGGRDDTFKSPPRKAAEQTSRPGSAARGQRREGLGAPSPSRAPRMREMPAERSAGLRTFPALLPRRAGPGCLRVPADFTPHPSLAAFQMPFFRCQNQKSSRGVGSEWRGKQSQSKPASNSVRATSLQSWMQAQAALRIPSSPRAFPRRRWVRSASCKRLFISYGALEWVSKK